MKPDIDFPEFDSPYMSVWIVAIDESGSVTILKAPNIHYAFFDFGSSPEDIGLPFEVEDTVPGVYRWYCSPWQSYDWETGYADDFGFEVISEDLLWNIDRVKPPVLGYGTTNQPFTAMGLIREKQKQFKGGE